MVNKLKLAEYTEFNGKAGSVIFITRALGKALFRRDDARDYARWRHALATARLAQALTIERDSKAFVLSIGTKTEKPDTAPKPRNLISRHLSSTS